MLYELVTKQKPFSGATRQATVNAILSSEPDRRRLSIQVCRPNWIWCSRKRWKKIASCVTKPLPIFAPTCGACCGRWTLRRRIRDGER